MLTNLSHDFQRTSPEQQGIASSAILEFVDAAENKIHELHSFMLLRHASVVAEGWWSPYGREIPHMMFSVSKSFTSTAIGLAISEGLFSIDDAVISFFPDETPDEVTDLLSAMSIRHLLSMSTGHTVDTYPIMSGNEHQSWVKSFLEVPVTHTPGTHFLYNTGATYMLSAIIQKITGMKLIDYLQPRLFEPLGIKNPSWQESPQGIALGGTGLKIKTEDIVRLGQLYLQKGSWQGKQLLAEAWVEEATAYQVSNGKDENSDWAQGYGYQFWRCRHNIYRGDGAYGQYCIVMPEQDAVLAMTGGLEYMQDVLNLVWDILLPAMGSESQAEDAALQNRLTEKLSSLNLPPVQGQKTSPIASKVSGQSYKIDDNDFKFEAIQLDFGESSCTLTIKTAKAEETIPCGYGLWQAGESKMVDRLVDHSSIVTSGAWTSEDTFTAVVRFYETPFYQTFVYHFADDELIIETWVNVSFDGAKKLMLTAHKG